MIKIVRLGSARELCALRAQDGFDPAVEESVAAIMEDVRLKGDEAVLEYTQRFDRVALNALELPQSEIKAAWQRMDGEFKAILAAAAQNITAFHSRQKRCDFVVNDTPGVVLGQKYTPLGRVGLYVPGGTARYPSSVLMDALPAKIAGVEEIIMATPPDDNGRVDDHVLCAAYAAGVTRIFVMGGAQAVAAMAYGTASVPKVDKIVGPGNIYVATAKKRVYGLVDVDMIAGPSEILIIADANSSPVFVAADLLSQAEHDALAAAVLITPCMDLATAVQGEVERRLKALPRQDIARRAVENQGCIFVVENIEAAIEAANEYAPEHLELCVDDPFMYLSRVRNAGSIFMGRNTPEALGDYMAGPNHTLPTGGTARFSSPLSVDDFVKKSSFIYYTRDALAGIAPKVMGFARREGLEAHAQSVECRVEDKA